ncbi:MAG TPA: hypothetical protein DD412_06675 [Holosporales bacterium]|nr:hypothetical protein [Holosporales bacterium]
MAILDLKKNNTVEDDRVLQIVTDALEEDDINVMVQKIVCFSEKKTRFFESFSSVALKDGAVLEAKKFMHLAKDEATLANDGSPIVHLLDITILVHTMNAIYMYKKRGIPVRFFYNVSAKTLLNRMFSKSLDYIFKEKKGFAESIIFEIPWIDLTENLAALKSALRKIKAYGASLSVDNVRNLNVNLLELHDLHFDFIKMDVQAFLKASKGEVNDFLNSCKIKNIDVVCCKIEDNKTLEEISAYNIKYAQGFLFDKPKPLKKPT